MQQTEIFVGNPVFYQGRNVMLSKFVCFSSSMKLGPGHQNMEGETGEDISSAIQM